MGTDEELKDEIRALRKEIGLLREELMVNRAYTSAIAIDSAGLHELSVSLSQGKDVPHGVDVIKRMLKLVELTDWPEPMTSLSSELAGVLKGLVSSFEAHDREKVKELAPKMHGAYHKLCNHFYDWLLERSRKGGS